MAASDGLLREWSALGFSEVFKTWLRSLSGTQNTVDDVADTITVINNDITTINESVTNITNNIDGGGLESGPTYVEAMASSDYPGVIEIATQAEVLAGTDATRAVTPAYLTDAIEGAGYWSPLTNGVVATPELLFALGDTITVWTEL